MDLVAVPLRAQGRAFPAWWQASRALEGIQLALNLRKSRQVVSMSMNLRTPRVKENTNLWLGIGHLVIVWRFQSWASIQFVTWRKVRGQLVLCHRYILHSTRGSRLSLGLYFSLVQN